MAKKWTLSIHPEYTKAFLHVVPDRNLRYDLQNAIWNLLAETDDPSRGAEPIQNHPDRYTIELLGYLVTFEVLKQEGKIRLLPITKA